jgi:hypothetical protein
MRQQCINAYIDGVGYSDRWCSDICSLEAKHTDTIFYVVRQNRLHPREMFILLEIEKGLQQIHGGGGSHPLYSTHCSLWCSCSCCNSSKAAAIAAHSFSLFSRSLTLHTLSLSLNPLTLLSQICLFYRQTWSTLRG